MPSIFDRQAESVDVTERNQMPPGGAQTSPDPCTAYVSQLVWAGKPTPARLERAASLAGFPRPSSWGEEDRPGRGLNDHQPKGGRWKAVYFAVAQAMTRRIRRQNSSTRTPSSRRAHSAGSVPGS